MPTMFGHAFGQAGPVEPGGFCYQFGITSAAGASFRSLDPAQASIMKMALVGWEAEQPPSGPLIEDALAIVHEPPDVLDVVAKPFVQTNPRQVGNMYRWVEMQLSRGWGIVIVPPVNFDPCGDLLRWTSGKLRAVATRNVEVAAELAGPGAGGVVLFAPADGWSAPVIEPPVDKEAPPPPPAQGPSSLTLGAVGVGLLVLSGMWWWTRKR